MSMQARVLALAIAAMPWLQGGAESRVAGSPPAASRPAASRPEVGPARGEQMILSLQGEPTTLLEPFCTTEDEINLAGLLFPTLLDITFRGELVHGPFLAESWEAAKDGLSITFLLRDAKWDDGKPITSADVIATHRLIADARFVSIKREYLERIAAVEALDPRRVRFRYKAKYYLQNQLADANFGILPAHVYGDLKPEDARGTEKALAPVGHGPFRVVGHEGTRRFVLERNERCATQPPPLLKRVVFQFTGDYEARKNALLTGEVDAVDGIRSDDLELFLKKGGFQVRTRALRSVDFVTWNTKKKPFDSAELRRALTLAIDRDGINKALFRVPVDGAVAPSFGTVPPVVEAAYAKDLRPMPFDRAESERKLDALGWKRAGAGKMRAKDGIPLSFTLIVNSETPRRVQTARMIQQDLAAAGVDAKIESIPFSALRRRVEERGYEAAIYGFTASLQMKMGDVWGREADLNLAAYENPRIDELLAAVRDETELAEISRDLREIQRIIHEDQPFTFLCWFSRYAVARDRFQDFGADVLAFTNGLNRCYVARSQQKLFVGE